MVCRNCGRESNRNFCPYCGRKLEPEVRQTPPVYFSRPEEISSAVTKKTNKKSGKKIILFSSLAAAVLSLVAVFLLCFFHVIHIPFLSDLFSNSDSEEKKFDENHIGAVYYQPTAAEHIITHEDGFMYADNEILLVASASAAFSDIEKLAEGCNAVIVGWIEQTGDYQLQINQNYTYEKLEEVASSLEKSPFVQDAYINFVVEMGENKQESRDGFIFGDRWESDLQNFNNCKGKSWGIEAIETLAAWDVLEANKQNVKPVKVGLIDGNFDTNHEDLGFAEVFYNQSAGDHGTHVAGTMAAKANNQEGICGVYPYGDGNLYGVSLNGVCSYDENGNPITSSMFFKIAYSELILRNVKVINSSLGFNYCLRPLANTGPEWDRQVAFLDANAYFLGDFLNRLIELGYDFVLVNSAGNDSDRANHVLYDSKYNFWTTVISEEDYPAVYDRIIVVGALNSDFNVRNSSNGGDRVDIHAPGGAIYSTIPNNEYDYKSGTSMAAPHVSGVAAMVWSVNNDLTGAQVKEIVCRSRSLRSDLCVDAYIAMEGAVLAKTSGSSSNPENGGILCWVVSAKNVNTKVQNAQVTFTNAKSGETVSATTDVYGHFECFLPAGQYSMSVRAENYEDYFSAKEQLITVKKGSVNYLNDWIKMEPTYSTEDIFGVYNGSYYVDQSEVGLTLSVYDEGARYKAMFEFYNISDHTNFKSGKYIMDVSYNISADTYVFAATEWIAMPADYTMLDLEGKLNGSVLSGETPTRFSVTKTPQKINTKVSLEDMPIVAHDRYGGNLGDSNIFNLNGRGLTENNDGRILNRNGNVGVDGTTYSYGFEALLSQLPVRKETNWASATFDLDGKFNMLTGKTSLINCNNTTNFDVTVSFYDGERLLASYSLTHSNYIKNIAVSVRGVKHLRVEVKDNISAFGGTSIALYDMFLDTAALWEGECEFYTQYLLEGGYDEIMINGADEEYLEISTCLIDIDNDGLAELLISLTDKEYGGIRGYPTDTVLLDIRDNAVTVLNSSYYSGGSMGGDYLELKYDQTDRKYVLALGGLIRDGFHAHFGYLHIYSEDFQEAAWNLVETYYSLAFEYYANEADKIRSETDLFYEKETEFRFYTINEEYVSYESYTAFRERFTDPVEPAYQMNPGTYLAPITIQ